MIEPGKRNTTLHVLKFPSRAVAHKHLADHLVGNRIHDTDHTCWFAELGQILVIDGVTDDNTPKATARNGWYVLMHAESIPPECEQYALTRNTTGRKFA